MTRCLRIAVTAMKVAAMARPRLFRSILELDANRIDAQCALAAVRQSPVLAKNCDGAIDGLGDFYTMNCDENQPLRCLPEYLSWAPFPCLPTFATG